MHTHFAGSRRRIAPSALALLESARHALAATECETSAGGRYVGAHLAASRAAAAVVASRGGGTPRGRGSQDIWELLPQVEPIFSEWAAFFAAAAGKRAAAEAGLPRAISPQEANGLLRDAETFVSIAESALVTTAQCLLQRSSAAVSSEDLSARFGQIVNKLGRVRQPVAARCAALPAATRNWFWRNCRDAGGRRSVWFPDRDAARCGVQGHLGAVAGDPEVGVLDVDGDDRPGVGSANP